VALFDSFPQELQDKLIDDSITPGKILLLFCNFTTPPKDKFIVVLSTSPLILSFVINSKIHPFIMARPELLNLQVEISTIDYPFLTHNSYIACHQLVNNLSTDEIKGQLKKDISRIKGELTGNTRLEIINSVRSSTHFSNTNKQMIIYNLGYKPNESF